MVGFLTRQTASLIGFILCHFLPAHWNLSQTTIIIQ